MINRHYVLAVGIPIVCAFFAVGMLAAYYIIREPQRAQTPTISQTEQTLSPTPQPSPALQAVSAKTLPGNYHVFQSFNNCGPAALSMALSHYGISESQQVLGQQLRPYQNPAGNNDDKSTTLAELARKAADYNLFAYHRPAGSIDQLKLFITYDMPIITRTLLDTKDDIGHYRVVKGFDSTTQELIQDDSLQGRNLRYSYDNFNTLWKKFNYEYVVLVPKDKKEIVESILGADAQEIAAWQRAVQLAQGALAQNPNDIDARFNLSVAYFHVNDYERAIQEFEVVENQLSFRTLWYQIEPIQAYFESENYARVMSISDQILNNHNRAFSELYILRGKVYLAQGDSERARQEFEKAVLYNQNLLEAQEALQNLQ